MIHIYTLKRDLVVFYVGATAKPDRRLREHYKKYGTGILMDVIETCSLEEVGKRELFWIAQHKSLNPLLVNKIESGHSSTELVGPISTVKIETSAMDLARSIKKVTGVPIMTFISKAVRNEYNRLPKSVKDKIAAES